MSLTRCSANGGHYYAHCRPNDGEEWAEFNDSSVREEVDPVITKAAYILFFRRVSSGPRTLESLRLSDDRCREDSDWMNELLSAPGECHGAEAAAHSSSTSAIDGTALLTAGDDSSDSERGCAREDMPFYNL